MNENLKKALELIAENTELQDKLKKMQEENLSAQELNTKLVSIVNEYGIELSVEDLSQDSKENINGELSEEELNGVVGGAVFTDPTSGWAVSDCVCYSLGGGTADIVQKSCACVGYGTGETTEYGKTWYDKNTVLQCLGYGTGFFSPVKK